MATKGRDFEQTTKSALNQIQNTKLFKNKNLVGVPEFTSGKTTRYETKFDLRIKFESV
jgi:hypothetical protein